MADLWIEAGLVQQDLQEVIDSYRLLTKQLAVALRDDAECPSLCDLIGPVKNLQAKADLLPDALDFCFALKTVIQVYGDKSLSNPEESIKRIDALLEKYEALK